jgi:hypothetical protein
MPLKMVLGQLRGPSFTDAPRNCPNQTSIIALPVLGVNDGDHRPVVIKNQEVGYEKCPRAEHGWAESIKAAPRRRLFFASICTTRLCS